MLRPGVSTLPGELEKEACRTQAHRGPSRPCAAAPAWGSVPGINTLLSGTGIVRSVAAPAGQAPNTTRPQLLPQAKVSAGKGGRETASTPACKSRPEKGCLGQPSCSLILASPCRRRVPLRRAPGARTPWVAGGGPSLSQGALSWGVGLNALPHMIPVLRASVRPLLTADRESASVWKPHLTSRFRGAPVSSS